jgi:tyrosine decarboxylase
MKGHDLDLFFLGPKSEQRQFLQEVLHLVLTDHIFWRRNYYPRDPPSIPYPVVDGDEARVYREKFFTELFALISDLKLDVPIFSPRYMAHMLSETTLPALVAYLATLFYNPNNVSSEASPVTIRYELEVGRQFAELFGFDPDRSFGHLASGGTLANYESLWFNRAGRLLPLSMALARIAEGSFDGKPDSETMWSLLNVPLDDVEGELAAFVSDPSSSPGDRLRYLQRFRPAWLGASAFQGLVSETFGAQWKEPVLIMPRTAHYSWSRSAALFGTGKQNIVVVDVNSDFSTDPDSYREVLETCLDEHRPVLQTVAVVGSTEFGSIDPVDAMVSVRDEMLSRGIYTPIHVDAAYGGYFATMFRSGQQHSFREETLSGNGVKVMKAFRALSECDSITVDPHKAGYVPYGAGGIIQRHGYLKDVVAEAAPYCLDTEDTTNARPQLGKYIMEGSKPGAAAASTWFSHRIIPLNMDGYGRQLSIVCGIADRFETAIRSRSVTPDGRIHIHSVIATHTNIVCLYARPVNAVRISDLNRLNERLAERFGVQDVLSIQSYDYLVSHTTISLSLKWAREEAPLAELEHDTDRLYVLRLVFMNRWVEKEKAGGLTYLEDFESQLRSEAVEAWSEMMEGGTEL